MLYTYINPHAKTPSKTETKYTMKQLNFVTLSLESDGCQHYYIYYHNIISHRANYRLTRFCFLIIIV